ncbi:nucleotide sugar dehydrogenase [Brevundimonas sp. S30B]|uniref:nucleotide sugar dehydrogenase n=1 Tax=unclassified Brevundimonas TaxID=2622653 RepID=UPI001072DF79|nr:MULTISPECIES: nucleotide sugar dehydrogenase [unclassified Brevundimonas]QBX37028.1 nucleotide sugar dehydrogenase [Brevundimonas sp. MF30-B]TFW04176.1 nucleotide sugar dehydrogenase [Brevundimonas sp. S30B]
MEAAFGQAVDRRDLRIAVIGLGYVGLPLLIRLGGLGFPVLGLDASAERLALIADGRSPIRHIPDAEVQGLIDAGCRFGADYADTATADVIIVCVPTPLTANRIPDMSHVEAVAQGLRPHLRAGQMIVLESTVYPGATEEHFRPIIEAAGLVPGRDVCLAYSPEREDPGNAAYSIHNTPKVCGGLTETCLARAAAFYGAISSQVVPVSSLKTAEMTKLLENIHRCVNIGLVNEMKVVADRMGVDVHEVISAAATKPFGFTAYWPGPGLGGHCIPIDPYYLSWKAREYGVDTRFVELAGQVNEAMTGFVVGKVTLALNDQGLSVRGARVLVCGLAYKKNVDDLRKSPALPIIDQLRALGAHLEFDDRYVTELNRTEVPSDLRQVDVAVVGAQGYDCVVLVTDHDYYDFDRLLSEAPALVDTRGRYRRAAPGLYGA